MNARSRVQDEEDSAWLALLNEHRAADGLNTISELLLETIIDRFEKESFLQVEQSGEPPEWACDEDALCAICMDGECDNSNAILFCDACNLPVHQVSVMPS